jgi:hypothetical protein
MAVLLLVAAWWWLVKEEADHVHAWAKSVMKSGEVWYICRLCGLRRA